jgi:hypothetical protein
MEIKSDFVSTKSSRLIYGQNPPDTVLSVFLDLNFLSVVEFWPVNGSVKDLNRCH